MLRNEYIIGDYINFDGSMGLREKTRERFVSLLEELNLKKNYKEETLYVAQSIIDRYLVHLVVQKQKLPC